MAESEQPPDVNVNEPQGWLKDGLRRFLRLESASGIVLMAVLGVTLVVANSPGSDFYNEVLDANLTFAIEHVITLHKPMVLWVNQGLMAVFFMLIAAEVKREMVVGEMRNLSQVVMPVVAGLAGMAVPMGIYLLVVWLSRGTQGFDPKAWGGWPIPMATDIAFTMGVVTLLGKRVPVALKVFLLTLSMVDDLGSALVISLFYSADLSTPSLVAGGLCLAALLVLNLSGVKRLAAYFLVGMVFWIFVIDAGMTATVAGMALGLALPMKGKGGLTDLPHSPLRRVEVSLHPWVAFMILPLFVFGNGGIVFAGLGWEELRSPVMWGIGLGMVLGKPLGVFTACVIMVKSRLAKLPAGVSWVELYGLACLTGIGFTMSLFIGSIAFIPSPFENDMRLGVLGGSLLSALWGSAVFVFWVKRKGKVEQEQVPEPVVIEATEPGPVA